MQHRLAQTYLRTGNGLLPAIWSADMAAATQLYAPKVSSPKDLYEIGEVPPLGHVPAKMHAWEIGRAHV